MLTLCVVCTFDVHKEYTTSALPDHVQRCTSMYTNLKWTVQLFSIRAIQMSEQKPLFGISKII